MLDKEYHVVQIEDIDKILGWEQIGRERLDVMLLVAKKTVYKSRLSTSPKSLINSNNICQIKDSRKNR